MSIRQLYYYWFYKYYKLLNSSFLTRENSKTKAGFTITGLEIWFLFSLYNYYQIIIGRRDINLSLLSVKVLVPLSLIVFIKWLAFIRDDKWKGYVYEFDQWPKERNLKGSWIVFGVTVFIIANFIISNSLNPFPGG